MEIRQHEWLSASPHEGFEQMRLKSRPKEPSPSLTRVGANFYSSVKQQDYSASVWLRRKDKLEHSQQKCIVIFALVCCFAVLVALIFSAVDIMGEDEDGLSEKNCQNKCRGQRLFEKLLQLTSQNIEVKLVSDVTADSKVLEALKLKGAEVTYMNMTAYNKGRLQSSFWIVDKQHVYIGSAGLDWRSLGQVIPMKELGVIFYNCSCLVLDLQRIFALYSSLKFKSRVPQTWSKRLYGVYDNEKKLQLQLNETKSQAFVSNSPKLFCPKNRSFDIDAIYSVIDDAKQYVYIAVTDYLPISSTSTKRTYWPDLDGKIREALVLRSVKVRLLISFWKETDPLTFNFISSLKAICTEIANCSLKVHSEMNQLVVDMLYKFFDLERENACATKEQKNQTFPKLNRNKYMVTDGAAYIGNFDWVGNDFTQNAGTGLVINQADVRGNRSIIKQLKDVFERDWYSPYAKSIQPTKQPNCSSLSKLKSLSNQPAISNATGREP
ncbi:Inactive phospholipase D5 [Apodemus speciosus]|uniref:Inactive phospholipase D5 n=1 Tax=Apodemus speciosus TaxID=105296 RepID=A0ABQ0EFX2_APOSI